MSQNQSADIKLEIQSAFNRESLSFEFIILEQPLISAQCPGKVFEEFEYRIVKHSDVSERDLLHVQAQDLTTVQKVCDMFDDCAAFNSNGWLKSSASFQESSQSNLYVKLKANSKVLHKALTTLRNKKLHTPLSDTDHFQLLQTSTNISERRKAEPSDYSEMMTKLKVYVYQTNIGSEHRPHRTGGYAVERLFAEILLKSPFITKNPNEAMFFFIPIRCSSYILDASNEHTGLNQARRFVGEILDEIRQKNPYWSWSGGSDHFYICAHDVGAAIGDGLLKNSIALVNTADYDDPYFIPHKDISLPPSTTATLNSLSNRKGGALFSSTLRSVFAFFAGNFNSGRIRQSTWSRWSQDKDIVLINYELPINSYLDYLKRTKYCLIVRGRESWSPRLTEAIYSGCVPVILSNHYHLPLQGIVNWNEFSVIIPESEIYQLKTILRRIPSTRLRQMQEKLQGVFHHFVWNNPARSNDAFYSVMLQLWHRRHVVRYKSVL